MNINAEPGAKPNRVDLVLRALLQAVALPFVLGVFLFLPAGRLDWAMAWALLGAYVAGTFVTALLLALSEPDLARERLQTPASAKGWDKAITSMTKVVTILVMLPVAGLDERFGWSPPLPLAVQLGGLSSLSWGMC